MHSHYIIEKVLLRFEIKKKLFLYFCWVSVLKCILIIKLPKLNYNNCAIGGYILTAVLICISLVNVSLVLQDGKTLKCLALEKGTEHIIRLIIEIDPAMVSNILFAIYI